MDEGWTRWVAEQQLEVDCKTVATTIKNDDITANRFPKRSIIFPDQSPNQILNGYPKGSMPDEYTGGVRKEGVENLKKFVEAGGTLVFLNRASDFAIEQFGLPVRDVTHRPGKKGFLYSRFDPPNRTRPDKPDRRRNAGTVDRLVRKRPGVRGRRRCR